MEDDNFECLCMEFVLRFNFTFSLLNRIVEVVSDDNSM